MNDRLLSVRRVLDVQVKLRRMAELKLAELQHQEQILQDEEVELTQFLGGDSPFAGVLSANIARRLRRNSQKQRETRQAKETQEAMVVERAARVKLAERMVDTIDEELRKSAEKRDLSELIEQFLARSDASFR